MYWVLKKTNAFFNASRYIFCSKAVALLQKTLEKTCWGREKIVGYDVCSSVQVIFKAAQILINKKIVVL